MNVPPLLTYLNDWKPMQIFTNQSTLLRQLVVEMTNLVLFLDLPIVPAV